LDLLSPHDKVDVRHSEVMQNALVIMNTNKAPTSDIVTRRAIIHAVDKSRFIKEEFAGLEQPVYQQMPFSAPYCNVELNPTWAFDFEKAQLLNCPVPAETTTSDKLPAWAIAVIAVGGALLVAVLAFLYVMYRREKQNKPLFTNINVETKDVEVRNA